VQENGSNAGVMFMTAFNKVVAGVGNRTAALMRMATLGLIQDEDITDDKAGRAIGIKPSAHVKGAAQFAENPLDWVHAVLQPALDAATAGMEGHQKAIRESQLISQMFPDRNAAKFFAELLQQ